MVRPAGVMWGILLLLPVNEIHSGVLQARRRGGFESFLSHFCAWT